MLTYGSLFAGIGGFDLGLERAGMRGVWQSELDPYCQRVLAKHWPDVLRVPDVRDVGADTVPEVDVICGGFPCQDISLAGKGAGLTGARSGLWSEYARIVGELRPRYVLVENVAALIVRGLPAVLADFSDLGYDAEWGVVSAADMGAPHLRRRLWIVAYPDQQRRREGLRLGTGSEQRQGPRDAERSGEHLGDPDGMAGTAAVPFDRRPGTVAPTTWAVIPDVIDGTAEDNDRLIVQWFKTRLPKGAPVWHMHEPVERLRRLCAGYEKVCIGSSGQYATLGSPAWHRRMDQAMNAVCARETPWLHMLRGMAFSGSEYPFASVDSSDIARNHNRTGNTPVGMARRWDRMQCPARWTHREQLALVEAA